MLRKGKESYSMKGHRMKKMIGMVLTAALILGLCHPVGNVRAEESTQAGDDLLAGTELLAHYEF